MQIYRHKVMGKKAAIELSIGTVVIIVLAMSMLILGLVLIRTIFSGATESINDINENVKAELKKLFQDENDRAVVRLTENTVQVKQGEEFNFAFAVRNNEKGVTGSQTFDYITKIVNKGSCPSEPQAEKWIAFGSGKLSVAPGQVEGKIIRLNIPEDAPLCTAEYRIVVWRQDKGETQNSPYADLQFFVKIKGSGIF